MGTRSEVWSANARRGKLARTRHADWHAFVQRVPRCSSLNWQTNAICDLRLDNDAWHVPLHVYPHSIWSMLFAPPQANAWLQLSEQ